MRTVRQRCVDVRIQRPGRRDGIALDTRNLNQPADRIAGQTQVVFQTHLRRVFDLRRRPAEELARRGGRHGARHADLALAPHLGPRNRGVRLRHVAEKPCRSQRPQQPDAQKVPRGGQVIEHRRNHTARSARRSRDDDAARGILLGGRQCVGVDLRTRGQRPGVALRLHEIGRCFPRHLQTARQHPVVVQPPLDRLAHRSPDRIEVVPDLGPLAVVHVLPVGLPFAVAPLLDLGDRRHRVDAPRNLQPRRFVGQRPAADAVNRPRIDRLTPFQPFEQHPVGVEGEGDLRLPDNLRRGDGFQHRADCHVREVAPARRGQRSVKRDPVGIDPAATLRKAFCGPFRPHRMAARRPVADLVEFFQRFHIRSFSFSSVPCRGVERSVAAQGTPAPHSKKGWLSPPPLV